MIIKTILKMKKLLKQFKAIHFIIYLQNYLK
jgi:hypothetical protein